MTLSPERQSARMSKITNDGLTRSGTGCFIINVVYPYDNSERQRVKTSDHTGLVRGDGREEMAATKLVDLKALFVIDIIQLLEVRRSIDSAVGDEAALSTDQRPRQTVVPALPGDKQVSTSNFQLTDDQL